MSKPKTPAEFARTYKLRGDSPSRRLAFFLYDAAIALPGIFFEKPQIAKIIFGLPRLPAPDGDHVKKQLSGLKAAANKTLQKEFKREIWGDRIEGWRATTSDEDLTKTTHRQKRRRVQTSIASLKITNDLIDPKKLTAATKAEYLTANAQIQRLEAAARQLPQLLDGKSKRKTEAHSNLSGHAQESDKAAE